MYKLLADENIPGLDVLPETFQVITKPGRSISREDVQDIDFLLVRSVTNVNEDLLQGSSVKFVGTCTIGVDHVDLGYLQEAGIRFSNAPGCNADAVVDYVLACLFVYQPSLDVLSQYTIGIVGLGQVGGRLKHRLEALGLRVKAVDPYVEEAQHSLDDVLACDVISLHVPLEREGEHSTYHLLDEQRLKQMKEGALLINSCRGKVIDNKALLGAIAEKSLKVVLDVYESEPVPEEALLNALLLATPHIAGYSKQGKLRGTQMVLKVLSDVVGVDLHSAQLLSGLETTLTASGLSIAELVLELYDIVQDKQDFLSSYLTVNEEDRAKVFESCRKHYAVRQEFGFIKVVSDLDEKVLKGLGLK